MQKRQSSLRVITIMLLMALLVSSVPLVGAQDGNVIELETFVDDVYQLESVRPVGWQVANPGFYMRGNDANDFAGIAIQSAPMSSTALFESLLPQLGLAAVPELSSTYASDVLTWEIYRFEVRGAMVALGMASDGQITYLVLVQSTLDEADALYDAVFVPAIAATQALQRDDVVPYRVEQVNFESDGYTLAGTLTIPEGDGPFPATIMMTGSGPQTRDSMVVPGFPIFEMIADHLTRNGVAVLRYDDRGVGFSEGAYAVTGLHDFANDGMAAMEYLRTRNDVNPAEVGLIGHSEGGYYAAVIGADERANPAFVIILAGAATDGFDVLVQQNRDILSAAGADQATIDEQMRYLDESYAYIVAEDWDGWREVAIQSAQRRWELFSETERVLSGYDSQEAFAEAFIVQASQGYDQRWFATFLAYDPTDDLLATTAPILVVLGGKDIQVDAEINAAGFATVLADHPDVEIVILPDANHLFQAATLGTMDEYFTLPPEFDPAFLPTLSDWLATRVTLAE